jgi:serine phosphatase RsbU (regulator of sigma subunit)/anti-sigma regulatory factor (Ser/Thr protein kinase)
MNRNPASPCVVDCPRDLEAVREATRSLRTYMAGKGLDEQQLAEWELVMVEAGNNAAQYVRPGSPCMNQPIRFVVNVTPEWVEVAITDHSEGFDWPDEVGLPPDDSEHGRGLFLISELTDSVRYLRGNNENFLIMRKARPASTPATDVQRDDSMETTMQMMTEELVSTYESLAAIFRFSSELGQVEDIKIYAAKWMGELLNVTNSTWFVLRQFDPATSSLKLVCSEGGDAPCPAELPIVSETADASSIEVAAANRGADVWFDSTTRESSLSNLSGAFGHPLSGVCHPIFIARQLFGVLTIGTRMAAPSFSISQINVIHTFADLLGVQINNVQNQKEAMQARVVTRELQVAAGIQRSLLPRVLPQPEGFQIAAHSSSASQVGGDFYDVITSTSSGFLLAIADVMGKGVPAAMFAAIFRSHLRARPDLLVTPGKLMKWLNRVLFADLDNVDMFVTAQLAYLDTANRKLTLASAGHCPAMLVCGPDHGLRVISGDGPPLGITLDSNYSEDVSDLPIDSRLLMYTDGLVELRNAEGRPLGDEAVAAWLVASSLEGNSAAAACASLSRLANDHRGGKRIKDDITYLMFTEDKQQQSPTTEDRQC